MIEFVFDEAQGCVNEATAERIRKTIEHEIRKDLEGLEHLPTNHEPRIVVTVSGDWVGGRFEVHAIDACCLHYASEIYNRLLAPGPVAARP